MQRTHAPTSRLAAPSFAREVRHRAQALDRRATRDRRGGDAAMTVRPSNGRGRDASALTGATDEQQPAWDAQTQQETDETAADLDQTHADFNQAESDADQWASDSDQRQAARDQSASDRDQVLADWEVSRVRTRATGRPKRERTLLRSRPIDD